MDSRQRSWPRIWLMTDERVGDGLWGAIGRLPESAGIVVRHYSLDPKVRRELAERVAGIAHTRRLTLAIAGDIELARRVGADLAHNPDGESGDIPFSRSVHRLAEAQSAKADGAALVFVSPIHPTRSHPRAAALGAKKAAEIARAAAVPAIALGGMNAENFKTLERAGFYGWAAIDAWLRA